MEMRRTWGEYGSVMMASVKRCENMSDDLENEDALSIIKYTVYSK